MSVLRQDVSTKEWVIIATERAKRPHEFANPSAEPRKSGDTSKCPFCPGHERLTPPEVLAFRPDDTSRDSRGWWVRVIPNKFAALSPSVRPIHQLAHAFFPYMDGVGVHEVIVESPSHTNSLALLDTKQVSEVLFALRLRFQTLRKDRIHKAVIIFKNHGERAGTSLAHPHCQLVATPVVPREIRMRHQVAQDYYDSTGRCIYCDMLNHELMAKDRIVYQTSRFVAFHPFASRSPFETWILPHHHSSSFGNAPDEDIRDLAHVLHYTLRNLYFGLNDPDYNLIIHTAPLEDEDKLYYLWHIQIIPRLTTIAGFELGSGIYINTALPEETAAFMREIREV